MNFFYWDASALVKRYAPEIGTPLVNYLFSKVAVDRMTCLTLAIGEVISVFVRKKNAGVIPEDAGLQAMIDFRAEVIDSAGFKLTVLDDGLVFASLPLIQKYSINATDALVLRSSLDAAALLRDVGNGLVFVASDLRLLQAAQAEGQTTFNPETDSQKQIDLLI